MIVHVNGVRRRHAVGCDRLRLAARIIISDGSTHQRAIPRTACQFIGHRVPCDTLNKVHLSLVSESETYKQQNTRIYTVRLMDLPTNKQH